MPPSALRLRETDVTKYTYNPAKAKALLQQAGLTLPVQDRLLVPDRASRGRTCRTRKRNFEAFAASLEKSGFKVVPHSAPWRPDYVGDGRRGQRPALYLIGWTGDFGDPDNFLGVFFQAAERRSSGFNNPAIFDAARQGARPRRTSPSAPTLYQQANKMIMKFLPGVPYVAHEAGARVPEERARATSPSPVSLEPFATVYVRRG